MNPVYQQVGLCLSHSIRGLECPQIMNLEPDLVMQEAKEHDVEGLVYKVLKSQVDLSAYKKAIIFKSLTQANYFKKALGTLHILKQNGIKVVLLKGSVLKGCYPQADLRMMGDVDILVPSEQLHQVHEILTHLGYTRRYEQGEKDYTYDDGEGFHLEVHWSLINASRQSGTQVFEQNLWSHLQEIEVQGMTFYRLSNEDFLIHLILHMAGHFRYVGFGIRQLCDLVLWIEQHDIDFEEVIKRLREMKLLTFSTYVMEACHTLLDFEVPDLFKKYPINSSDLEYFIESLFSSGVHGHREKWNRFGHNLAYRKNNGIKCFIFFLNLFPSINFLSPKYTYAHKYHWLLPIAWVHRLFREFFHQRFSFSEKFYILMKTPSVAKQKSKLLQSLGLVE